MVNVSVGTMTATACKGDADCELCPLMNAAGYIQGAAWLVYDCADHQADRIVLSNSNTDPGSYYVIACEVEVFSG